jgi:hypothetical protein
LLALVSVEWSAPEFSSPPVTPVAFSPVLLLFYLTPLPVSALSYQLSVTLNSPLICLSPAVLLATFASPSVT